MMEILFLEYGMNASRISVLLANILLPYSCSCSIGIPPKMFCQKVWLTAKLLQQEFLWLSVLLYLIRFCRYSLSDWEIPHTMNSRVHYLQLFKSRSAGENNHQKREGKPIMVREIYRSLAVAFNFIFSTLF